MNTDGIQRRHLPFTGNARNRMADKRLKNNKSVGLDRIQSEILKTLNTETIRNIHKLMEHIWEDEIIS